MSDRAKFEPAKVTIELPLHNVCGPICPEDLKREVQRVVGRYGTELQQSANRIVATCASGELVLKNRHGEAGFTPSIVIPATSLPGNEKEAHVQDDYRAAISSLDGCHIALDLRAPGSPMEKFSPSVVHAPKRVVVYCGNEIIGILQDVKTHVREDALSLHGHFALQPE